MITREISKHLKTTLKTNVAKTFDLKDIDEAL